MRHGPASALRIPGLLPASPSASSSGPFLLSWGAGSLGSPATVSCPHPGPQPTLLYIHTSLLFPLITGLSNLKRQACLLLFPAVSTTLETYNNTCLNFAAGESFLQARRCAQLFPRRLISASNWKCG